MIFDRMLGMFSIDMGIDLGTCNTLVCVKGQGIWVGSARAFIDGGNRDPIMVYSAWWLLNAQERAMLQVMGKL